MDELLNGEIFYTLREAQILIEQWRIYYNTPSRDIAAQYPAGHRSGHTAHWATVRLRLKASSQWNRDQQCTNNQTGTPNGGTPPAIGMVNAALRWPPQRNCHVQGPDREVTFHAIADSPANDTPGMQVKDDGQIEPAFAGPHIADVHCPAGYLEKPNVPRGACPFLIGRIHCPLSAACCACACRAMDAQLQGPLPSVPLSCGGGHSRDHAPHDPVVQCITTK